MWFTQICVVVTEILRDLPTFVWLLLSFCAVYSRLGGCYRTFVWFTHDCVIVTKLSCGLLTSVWLLLSFRVVHPNLCGCH